MLAFFNRFGVPVYLQNDADACALAEWTFGAGSGIAQIGMFVARELLQQGGTPFFLQ